MKITVISISGEADHPLLKQFEAHYKQITDNVIIQTGVVNAWRNVNGDTSESGIYFLEKVEQQNAALEQVPADTDYLFYFDIDEFMDIADLKNIIEILKVQPRTILSFQMFHFWKSGDWIGRGGDGWAYDSYCPRVFKYTPGMYFTTHRPPKLMTPKGHDILHGFKTNLPHMVKHYSYIYEKHVLRKLKYYDVIYPNMNYMSWFNNVFLKWNERSRPAIEAKYSIHPSCAGAKSELYTGKHEIIWQI